jgi:hypothetical protein
MASILLTPLGSSSKLTVVPFSLQDTSDVPPVVATSNLFIGSEAPIAVYVGSEPVLQIYVGSELVWEAS